MPKRAKKPAKGSWIVNLKCTVRKEVICDGCTEEEATHSPYTHAVSETETEMTDWDVMSVEPND